MEGFEDMNLVALLEEFGTLLFLSNTLHLKKKSEKKRKKRKL